MHFNSPCCAATSTAPQPLALPLESRATANTPLGFGSEARSSAGPLKKLATKWCFAGRKEGDKKNKPAKEEHHG